MQSNPVSDGSKAFDSDIIIRVKGTAVFMKKTKRLRAASMISFIMAVLFGISSLVTFNVRADDGMETQETGSEAESHPRITYGSAFGDASNESILEPSAPTGYDEEDEANPYGARNKEDAFLLFKQSELFALYGEDLQAENAWTAKAAIYDTHNGTNAENVLGENWNSRSDINYGDLLGNDNRFLARCSYIQAASFDPTKSGRDDHIAFIGICKKDDSSAAQAWVWVYDVINKRISEPYCMGDMSTELYLDHGG